MLETKPSNIQVRMLKAQLDGGKCRRAVRSWLKLATSQSATIKLVGAQDDSMAMGARKAFQEITNEAERSRWLSLPFTGCDGQPATGQVWVRENRSRQRFTFHRLRDRRWRFSQKPFRTEPNRLDIP